MTLRSQVSSEKASTELILNHEAYCLRASSDSGLASGESRDCVQEVDTVVGGVEKLGQVLGVDPQVAQSLVTRDPRYRHAISTEQSYAYHRPSASVSG